MVRYQCVVKRSRKNQVCACETFPARPVRCWRLYLFPFVVKEDFNKNISFIPFPLFHFFPINEVPVLLLFNCTLWVCYYRTFLPVESEWRQMNCETVMNNGPIYKKIPLFEMQLAKWSYGTRYRYNAVRLPYIFSFYKYIIVQSTCIRIL